MSAQNESLTSKVACLNLALEEKENFFNSSRRAYWEQFLSDHQHNILARTWQTRQQREEFWHYAGTDTFSHIVKPLIEELVRERDQNDSKSDDAKFHKGVKGPDAYFRAQDSWHVWLVDARCVKYRFDGVNVDMDVLSLSVQRLADDLLGTRISLNFIERMRTRCLDFSYEVKGLNKAECSYCEREFKRGDTLKQLPCQERHEFHKNCIETYFVTSNECPDCTEIVYPEKDRYD